MARSSRPRDQAARGIDGHGGGEHASLCALVRRAREQLDRRRLDAALREQDVGGEGHDQRIGAELRQRQPAREHGNGRQSARERDRLRGLLGDRADRKPALMLHRSRVASARRSERRPWPRYLLPRLDWRHRALRSPTRPRARPVHSRAACRLLAQTPARTTGPRDTSDRARRQRSRLLLELIEAHLPVGEASVLEVGCNAGRNLAALFDAGSPRSHGDRGERRRARACSPSVFPSWRARRPSTTT